jgi:hypothetical protein
MTLLQYLKKLYCKETLDLLQLAPCGVRAYVDKLPSGKRDQCRRDMEGIAGAWVCSSWFENPSAHMKFIGACAAPAVSQRHRSIFSRIP